MCELVKDLRRTTVCSLWLAADGEISDEDFSFHAGE